MTKKARSHPSGRGRRGRRGRRARASSRGAAARPPYPRAPPGSGLGRGTPRGCSRAADIRTGRWRGGLPFLAFPTSPSARGGEMDRKGPPARKSGVKSHGQRAEEVRKPFGLGFGKPFRWGKRFVLFVHYFSEGPSDTRMPVLPLRNRSTCGLVAITLWVKTHYKYLLQPHNVQSRAHWKDQGKVSS